MATQYKTKCPHCQAQFRISEQHLMQAKGQVRCGSCLKVFLATEHLVNEAPAAKAAAPKPPAPKPPAAKAPAPKAPTPETWTLPPEETKSESASRWTLDEASESSGDDAGLIDDFSEDEIPEARPASNDTKVSLGGLELSDSFISLDGDDDERLRDEDFSDMAGAGRGSQSHDSDESWAEKLLEELDEDAKPDTGPISADTMSLHETDAESSKREAKQKKKERTKDLAQKASKDDDSDWARDNDSDFFSDSGFGLLDEDDNDEVAAIELPRAEKKSVTPNIKVDALLANTTEILRWGALSVLMMLVFGLQYMAFNFNELARTPEWRGFYSTVCGAFGCQLPNPSDVSKLRGANLVVRKHPTFSNALVVDVLLFNKADYEQPFPEIELGFTSVQGAAVASRRFSPKEYLHGDLAGASRMPIETPVHISLEILDPGENAKNYTLRFFPTPVPSA
ncbi:MAG: DUF3426 domain-containing protein [Alcanivoracaceae bacterium]|nr:DUF3426 domain-containing protein [Alcanivoracaceae bacterium]